MVWLISKSNVWLLMLFVKLCSINNLTIWLKFLRFKTFSIAPNGQQHEPTKIFTTRHWELKKEWKNDKYTYILFFVCENEWKLCVKGFYLFCFCTFVVSRSAALTICLSMYEPIATRATNSFAPLRSCRAFWTRILCRRRHSSAKSRAV